MEGEVDAVSLLESERTILERAVRTAWKRWAPEDLRSSLGPSPSIERILENLDALRNDDSSPVTSRSAQRPDERALTSSNRSSSAVTVLANFVSAELTDTPASAALTEVTKQDIETLQIFLYSTDAAESEVAQRRQQIDGIWDKTVLGLYYTSRKVSEISIGSILTAHGQGSLTMMGSGELDETFRHLKLCMAAGGFEFRGIVGTGQLNAGLLFTPEGRGE